MRTRRTTAAALASAAATFGEAMTTATAAGGPWAGGGQPPPPRDHPLSRRVASSASTEIRHPDAERMAPAFERWEAWADEIAAEAGAAAAARMRRGESGGGNGNGNGPPSSRRQVLGGGGERRRRGAETGYGGNVFNGGASAAHRLRADLLANYDRTVFPWTAAWEVAAEEEATDDSGRSVRKGLSVELGINFHRVFEVDVERSTASLVVWLRQRWVDPRLSWDPADYDNLTTAHFWVGEGSGPGGETSEIWTPDLELWNLEVGLADSLSDAPASVDPSGSVFWSRPGHLRPVCKFRGLDDFPFDELGCTVEIGSWAHSGLYVRPTLMGDGFTIGGSETAGESYAEFKLGDAKAREHVYPPFSAASPDEDWPVVLYDVTFRRSWQPYVRGYLTVQIILNLVAFSCFWLPPQCGERMGLAITSLLASVTSELVVAANLPYASELTWFAKFSLTSLAFSAVVLFECAAVIYLFYRTKDDLVPGWAKWSRSKWVDWRGGGSTDSSHSSGHDKGGTEMEETVNRAQRVPIDALESIIEVPSSENSLSDDGGDEIDGSSHHSVRSSHSVIRVDAGSDDSTGVECQEESFDREEMDLSGDMGAAIGVERASSRSSNRSSGSRKKESASFSSQPESDGSQRTRTQSAKTTKNFVRMSQKPVFTEWKRAQKRTDSFLGRQQLAPRSERQLSGRPMDAEDFKSLRESENNKKWQKVARGIDSASRVVFPVAYAIALAVLLGHNTI